ncbi:MAG: hypothetical protein ACRD1I_06070, partial [Terriglobia bacterium]
MIDATSNFGAAVSVALLALDETALWGGFVCAGLPWASPNPTGTAIARNPATVSSHCLRTLSLRT